MHRAHALAKRHDSPVESARVLSFTDCSQLWRISKALGHQSDILVTLTLFFICGIPQFGVGKLARDMLASSAL